jgi:hypothetical protein
MLFISGLDDYKRTFIELEKINKPELLTVQNNIICITPLMQITEQLVNSRH